MTKEELAKKKGIKMKKEKLNPAASLLTTTADDAGNKNSSEKDFLNPPEDIKSKSPEKKSPSKKPQTKKVQPEPEKVTESPVKADPVIDEVPVSPEPVEEKRRVGRPKTRKEGGKQMSFFLDADLIEPLYRGLGYRDSYAKRINDAIRWYVQEKGGF